MFAVSVALLPSQMLVEEGVTTATGEAFTNIVMEELVALQLYMLETTTLYTPLVVAA